MGGDYFLEDKAFLKARQASQVKTRRKFRGTIRV
jgi:hypothetical protein